MRYLLQERWESEIQPLVQPLQRRLLDLEVEQVTGKGAGLTDEALKENAG